MTLNSQLYKILYLIIQLGMISIMILWVVESFINYGSSELMSFIENEDSIYYHGYPKFIIILFDIIIPLIFVFLHVAVIKELLIGNDIYKKSLFVVAAAIIYDMIQCFFDISINYFADIFPFVKSGMIELIDVFTHHFWISKYYLIGLTLLFLTKRFEKLKTYAKTK